MGEEEKKYEQPTEPTTSPEPTPSGGAVSGGLKALFIILAIIFPVVGIILGIIWLKKKTTEEKGLGKMTLILGIIFFILQCICICSGFGLGILGSLGDYSMLLPLISVA